MFFSRTTLRRTLPAGVLLAVLGGASLTGCGSDSGKAGSASPTPAAVTPGTAAAPVTVTDPWVKAAAGGGMTGIFATIANNTGAEINVVSATSSAAKMVELHEVVGSGDNTTMRRKEGGFVIAAKGTHELKPGGDHIMLMGLGAELKPGAEVSVTLTLKDGRTVPFTAVVKEFAGGNENYQPGHGGASPSMSPMKGMSGMGDAQQSHG